MTENRKLGGDESLSERRNFLLKSLHGLDQELADGNLDPEDHELLVARYTRQLAALAQREKITLFVFSCQTTIAFNAWSSFIVKEKLRAMFLSTSQ